MIKSVYIHIPFCDRICSYCDFPKILSSTNYQDEYLCALEKEIKQKYRNEVIETIYVGGGTPSSLSLEQLTKLLEIIKVFKTDIKEYTFEVNIESIDEEKAKLLNKYGVNRLSIGIETFQEKFLKILNRHHTKAMVQEKIKMLKKYFNNINVDLMYAFKDETLKNLKFDLEEFKKLDVEHISTYSLMIEPNTVLYNNNIEPIDEELDYLMYEEIIKSLDNYHHYEISNFAKNGYESKHNLTYWHNLEYYGFGLGTSGYIGDIRYTNTRSINNYFNGNYVLESHELDNDEILSNEFILGLRLIDGIDCLEFKKKYNLDILSISKIAKLVKENKLIFKNNRLYIAKKYIYISNEILVELI